MAERKSLRLRWPAGLAWAWRQLQRPALPWLIATAGAAGLAALLYFYVVAVVWRSVPLPATIAQAPPRINRALLDQVTARRVERLQAAPHSFAEAAPRIFGL